MEYFSNRGNEIEKPILSKEYVLAQTNAEDCCRAADEARPTILCVMVKAARQVQPLSTRVKGLLIWYPSPRKQDPSLEVPRSLKNVWFIRRAA